MAIPITVEKMRDEVEIIMAEHQGYEDGRNLDMSNPNEPRFEDDFDVDTDPHEPAWHPHQADITLYDIASNKAHAYAQEYDTNTGGLRDKPNYHALKEGYVAGFLEGFAHRLTNNTGE